MMLDSFRLLHQPLEMNGRNFGLPIG